MYYLVTSTWNPFTKKTPSIIDAFSDVDFYYGKVNWRLWAHRESTKLYQCIITIDLPSDKLFKLLTILRNWGFRVEHTSFKEFS